MSKTKFVEYGERGFWAYDVALDIFLKYLIDAAEASDQANTNWLSTAISDWRVACVPDFGLKLDTDWTAAQQQTFIVLSNEACARLAARESIPAEEIVSWPILDDVRIFPRGATRFGLLAHPPTFQKSTRRLRGQWQTPDAPGRRLTDARTGNKSVEKLPGLLLADLHEQIWQRLNSSLKRERHLAPLLCGRETSLHNGAI